MHSYRKALVLGLGSSGEAAAALLRAEGAGVTVVDRADTPPVREAASRLGASGVEVLLGAEDLPATAFDICIVSPGVPLASPWIAAIRDRKVRMISELELGWSRRGGRRIAAITGSNGKSTAVKWLAETLRRAGLKASPAGNYGPPICKVVGEGDDDWLVVEVSSFQLETARDFRPEVGILLNVHHNHFDRHGDFETYLRAKARLFARTTPRDACIVHAPWLDKVRALSGGRGRWLSFGAEAGDYRFEGGKIIRGITTLADFGGTYFGNPILGLAAAAVTAAVEACGVSHEYAVQAAREFEPLPHRMQEVAEIGGVRYVNDSKATNLAALSAALRMLPGRARLIAGGLVKEKDMSRVKEVLAEKASGVYLIGLASEEMASAWSDVVPCFRCGTLDAAVRKAGDDAQAGETVLLSPACASFDQFRNYEERGRRFEELARARAGEGSR